MIGLPVRCVIGRRMLVNHIADFYTRRRSSRFGLVAAEAVDQVSRTGSSHVELTKGSCLENTGER
ncbi:MAG: hypothetical protein V7637_83 [Mycobacteriales bacterium]